jgi:hypothetical protein
MTLMASMRSVSSRLAGLAVVLAFAGVVLFSPVTAHATAAPNATLSVWTNPSTGLAGFNNVGVTVTGLPSGIAASSVTASFAATCGGTPVASDVGILSFARVATLYRAEFAIPSTLMAGTYYVTLTGSSPVFGSANCSEINVTATTAALAACVPTSSLAVVAGSSVNAYVPNGYWEGGYSGVEMVPLEAPGPLPAAATISTPGVVNSCAANSVTGEVVCTENTAYVDLINGTTLTNRISSGANQSAYFTGGNCLNCGVGINPTNNTAVIAGGFSGGNSGQGIQVLNLATNTFSTPFPMNGDVSEDISIDSQRGLILSPGEDGSYQLLQIGAGGALTEYDQNIYGLANSGYPHEGYYLDSAAEDCTTGIALSANEFEQSVYITDLTQATFTPGSPAGTWSAPGQYVPFPYTSFAAGSSGLSTAPGTGHLAIVTGEFGGSSYVIMQLPSTSGTGTPGLVDWVYISSMPNAPDYTGFAAGFDPHTVTAYTSPNTNKSFAVIADYGDYSTSPGYLGVVDMACALALPRTPGTNVPSGDPTASSCTTFFAVP